MGNLPAKSNYAHLSSPASAEYDPMTTAAKWSAHEGAGGFNGAAPTNCRLRGPAGRFRSRDPQASEALCRCGSHFDRTSQEQSELDFLAELKRWFDGQDGGESSVISCVLSPYLLTIYYRGETVGSWRATREGARWHDRHKEDATTVVLRDVYDAVEHTKRALFVRFTSLTGQILRRVSTSALGHLRSAADPDRRVCFYVESGHAATFCCAKLRG